MLTIKKNIMKRFIIILITLVLFSCERIYVVPHTNGGVFNGPDFDVNSYNESSDRLPGTVWILTYSHKVWEGYSQRELFIIRFSESSDSYELNGKKHSSYKYKIVKTMDIGNPYNLILYGFSPFGANGVWSGVVPNDFAVQGKLNKIKFKNTSNSELYIIATFERDYKCDDYTFYQDYIDIFYR